MAYDIGQARGEIVISYNGTGVARAKNDLRGLHDQGRQTGFGLEDVGRTAGRAGLAIAVGLGAGVVAAAKFESRMSAIKAVSGATGSQMETLRQKALQLGKDTAFSATEAAQAMEELAKAGLTIPQIMNGAADATVALAAAGEISLPRAAEVAANAMNAFNISAKQMPYVADILAGTANASAISVDELAHSMQMASAVANTTGFGLKETAAAIGLMGNAGIKGSDAGTSLKQMLLNLQPQTEKQTQLFRQLGLITSDGANRFFDAEGNVKDMHQVAALLESGLEDLTKQQRLQALETMFGSDAIRAAAVIAEEGGQGFGRFYDQMLKVKAADVAATKMDNLKGSLEVLKGSLETAGIQIGRVMLPVIRTLVEGITGLVDAFLTLPEGMQGTIVAILALTSMFLMLVAVVIKVILFQRMLQATLATTRLAFLTTWVAALGPIALVIAAIVAIIGVAILLYKKFEWFRNAVNAVWEAIKVAAKAVAEWFMSTVVPIFQSVWENIKAAFSAFMEWWGPQWEKIKQIVTAVWQTIAPVVMAAFEVIKNIISTYIQIMIAIWTAAWNVIKAVFTYVWENIKAVITAAIGIIKNVIELFLNLLTGNWSGAWENIKNIVGIAWELMKSLVMNALQFIVSIIQAVWGGLAGVVTAIWNGIKVGLVAVWEFIKAAATMYFTAVATVITTIWNGIKAVLVGIWNGISAAASAVWNAIKAVITAQINLIRTVITTVWNAIRAVTQTVWNGISSVVTTVWNAIKNAVTAAVNFVRNIITTVWNAIKAITLNAWNGVKTMITNPMEAAKNIVTNVSNLIKNALSAAWNAAKNATQSIWNGIVNVVRNSINLVLDAARNLGGNIANIIRSAGTALYNAGVHLIQMLINGFASGIGALWDTAKNALTGLRNLLPGSPVREGPLKVLNQGYAGKEIIRMIIGGLESMTPDLERVLRNALSAETATGGGVTRIAATGPAGLRPTDVSNALRAALAENRPAPVEPGPLIGTQHVYYPQAEPASQAAARQRTRTAALGTVG